MGFYGTATGFTIYHSDRGRDVDAYTTQEIETALLVCSEWMDGTFGDRWPGEKVADRETQIRDWPRAWAEDRDGWPVSASSVPTEVEHATYEVALRQLTDDEAISADFTPNKYRRVTIDGALTVEYRSLNAADVQKQFPVIGVILARLLGGSGRGSSLSGGLSRG